MILERMRACMSDEEFRAKVRGYLKDGADVGDLASGMSSDGIKILFEVYHDLRRELETAKPPLPERQWLLVSHDSDGTRLEASFSFEKLNGNIFEGEWTILAEIYSDPEPSGKLLEAVGDWFQKFERLLRWMHDSVEKQILRHRIRMEEMGYGQVARDLEDGIWVPDTLGHALALLGALTGDLEAHVRPDTHTYIEHYPTRWIASANRKEICALTECEALLKRLLTALEETEES